MMLYDTGVLTKMQYDMMNPEIYKPPPKVRYNTALSLLELSTAYMLEALGMMIGTIAFFGELCMGKKRKISKGEKTKRSPNQAIWLP